MPQVRTVAASVRTRKAAAPASSPSASKAKVKSAKVFTPAVLAKMPSGQVWQEYKKSPSQAIRNDMWEKHLPIVRYIAERTYARLPDEVDLGDLISAGQFGLMDAIDGFDLTRGVKFETFCAARIRGAI